jgi:hypothetical protein
MEELLTARLLASLPLTALVGTRINWLERPEGDALPSLTLTNVHPGRAYSHDGPDGLSYGRIQFDSWGASYLQAKRVSRAVRQVMEARYENDNVVFEDSLELSSTDQKPERLPGGTPVFRILSEYTVPFILKGA